MHHLIYPLADTYVTNRPELEDKNFGIDEILQIGTTTTPVRTLNSTKEYVYNNTFIGGIGMTSFTGNFTGSFVGTIYNVNGNITGSNLNFSSSYFSGSINGNGIQVLTSSLISGSNINGYITGSVTASYSTGIFTGQLTGSSACLSGTGSGIDTRNEQYWTTTNTQYIDRSFLKFDLTALSTSISNGSIQSPSFYLKLFVSNEYQLPITYNIYALPISQSWNMGNGYFSDGGSDTGVSWAYRDNLDGTSWYSSSVSGVRPTIDYITTPALVTASFGYQGGTWYTSSWCSQSFDYQASDINMNITPMVMSWLSGSIPNQGLLLVSSDELQSTGSGFILKFFSKDTNTIYSPYLDVMWNDATFITGSQSTSSVVISTYNAGITSSIYSGSTLQIAGGISGSFSGSSYITILPVDDVYNSFSGIINGGGLSGNINGVPILGFATGSINTTQSLVSGSCGNLFSASIATGSFTSGIFSGSTFTAYYVDYKFENGLLSGSWTNLALLGSSVRIPIPSGIDPYSYAHVSGSYVNGSALGQYTLSGSTSASFAGQFINGSLVGGYLSLQLTGSVYTSSLQYTSSVEFTSSILSALDVSRPFTVSLQNLNPTYKSGDIIKIGVFGRKQFPLKTFNKGTQQEQYLVPEILPTSSYYALKDNDTDEMILNFDNYTQIGCEYPYGNVFMIDTTSLPQERYYKILIRVNNGQSIYTLDSGKTFKVIR